jgi:hypothetical protein
VLSNGLLPLENYSSVLSALSINATNPSGSGQTIDIRQYQVWPIGCILYELLHRRCSLEHSESAEAYIDYEWGKAHSEQLVQIPQRKVD